MSTPEINLDGDIALQLKGHLMDEVAQNHTASRDAIRHLSVAGLLTGPDRDKVINRLKAQILDDLGNPFTVTAERRRVIGKFAE